MAEVSVLPANIPVSIEDWQHTPYRVQLVTLGLSNRLSQQPQLSMKEVAGLVRDGMDTVQTGLDLAGQFEVIGEQLDAIFHGREPAPPESGDQAGTPSLARYRRFFQAVSGEPVKKGAPSFPITPEDWQQTPPAVQMTILCLWQEVEAGHPAQQAVGEVQAVMQVMKEGMDIVQDGIDAWDEFQAVRRRFQEHAAPPARQATATVQAAVQAAYVQAYEDAYQAAYQQAAHVQPAPRPGRRKVKRQTAQPVYREAAAPGWLAPLLAAPFRLIGWLLHGLISLAGWVLSGLALVAGGVLGGAAMLATGLFGAVIGGVGLVARALAALATGLFGAAAGAIGGVLGAIRGIVGGAARAIAAAGTWVLAALWMLVRLPFVVLARLLSFTLRLAKKLLILAIMTGIVLVVLYVLSQVMS